MLLSWSLFSRHGARPAPGGSHGWLSVGSNCRMQVVLHADMMLYWAKECHYGENVLNYFTNARNAISRDHSVVFRVAFDFSINQ
jgi:hypothetical protein